MISQSKVLLFLFSLLMPFLSLAQSDPTAPIGFDAPVSTTVKKKAVARRPRLEAILCNEGQPCSAILNGREVTTGQSINGYRISAIAEDSVTVTRGNRRWSLVLFNEQVKQ